MMFVSLTGNQHVRFVLLLNHSINVHVHIHTCSVQFYLFEIRSSPSTLTLGILQLK